MEDLIRYLDEIVDPTVEEFHRNPLSVRHAFIACVTIFHSIDYLAYPKRSSTLRQQFGRASEDFRIIDHVAHAFKHVVSGNPAQPNIKHSDVIKRVGVFAAGVFDPLVFDVGEVTLSDQPNVNLLRAAKKAVQFLRDYRPPARESISR